MRHVDYTRFESPREVAAPFHWNIPVLDGEYVDQCSDIALNLVALNIPEHRRSESHTFHTVTWTAQITVEDSRIRCIE